MMTLQLTVPNMACSACGDTITKAIQAIDAGAMVDADPKTKQVKIETQAPEDAIKQAIATAGYQVEASTTTIKSHSAQERAREDVNQDIAQ